MLVFLVEVVAVGCKQTNFVLYIYIFLKRALFNKNNLERDWCRVKGPNHLLGLGPCLRT